MSPFEISIVDIAICVILLVGALVGRFSGFLKSLVGLAAWVVGIVLGIMFGATIGNLIFPKGLESIPWLPEVIGFSLLLIAVLVVGAFTQQIVSKALDMTGLKPLDRVLGMVLGFLTGAFVVIAIGIIFELGTAPEELWKNSRLLQFLMEFEVFVRDILGSFSTPASPPTST